MQYTEYFTLRDCSAFLQIRSQMCLHNLKSICSVQKKRLPVVKGRDQSLNLSVPLYTQKPSHRMKRNLVGESCSYVLKNVGKSFWTNIHCVRLVSCIARSRM